MCSLRRWSDYAVGCSTDIGPSAKAVQDAVFGLRYFPTFEIVSGLNDFGLPLEDRRLEQNLPEWTTEGQHVFNTISRNFMDFVSINSKVWPTHIWI